MNEKCLLCNRNLNYKVDLEWLFSVAKIQEQFICEDCQKRFVKIEGPTCLGCGKIQANLCADCQRWQRKKKKLLHNKALYVYQNQAMKEFFKQYKFMENYHLRKIFQAEFEEAIQKRYSAKKWIYVPIPVDQETAHTRMFNQVKGLVENLPLCECLKMQDMHKRIRQSHKKREERLQTKQPFKLSTKFEVKQKNILLIDDIYTTGQTLYHAQEIFLKANVNQVCSMTLGR